MGSDDPQRGHLSEAIPAQRAKAIWHEGFPWQNTSALASDAHSNVEPRRREAEQPYHDDADEAYYREAVEPYYHETDEPYYDKAAAGLFAPEAVSHRLPGVPATLGELQLRQDIAHEDEADPATASADPIGAPRAWRGSVHRRPKASSSTPMSSLLIKVGLGIATAAVLVLAILTFQFGPRPAMPSPHPTAAAAPFDTGAAQPVISPVSTLTSQTATQPTEISNRFAVTGQVFCKSGRAVQGVWIQANKGSGNAQMKATGSSTWHYSYALPAVEPYSLRIGCGGSPEQWATTAYTTAITGAPKSIECLDTVGTASAKCRVT